MRISIDLETDGHEYRVELESDGSVPRLDMIKMAAGQIDQMAKVSDHHEALAATLDEVARHYAPAAEEQ